jgi:hypothetical protein
MKALTLQEDWLIGTGFIWYPKPLEFPSVDKDDSIWLISDAAQTMNADLKII